MLICPLQIKLAWCCEHEEWKAGHLMRAFSDIPVFKEMEDLCKPMAKDWRYDGLVPVEQVKGLWDGYPCTSISSCTGKPASFSDESSATGAGYRSLLNYIDSNASLEWIICENVRNMYHQQMINGTWTKPAIVQNEELIKRGFVNCSQLVQSSMFGLPQSRTRCWILYVRLSRVKHLNSMDLTFKLFECQPLPLTTAFSGSNAVPTRRCNKPSENWKQKYKDHCEAVGEEKVSAVCEKLASFPALHSGLTAREFKVLAVAVAEMECHHNPWDDILVVQVDQNFGRNWCRRDPRLCPCVVPKGKYVLTHFWKFLAGQVGRLTHF